MAEWNSEAENYYKLVTSNKRLNATDPFAKGIEIRKECIGGGGQGIVFFGQFDLFGTSG
ncbi:MAG: hypothetical protein QW165_04985 [Candidatus Woesearchaeota archaeon]